MTPNPSIEGDVQGLAPLAAPHVKRWAAAANASLGSRLSTLLMPAVHSSLAKQSQKVGLAAVGTPGEGNDMGLSAAP